MDRAGAIAHDDINVPCQMVCLSPPQAKEVVVEKSFLDTTNLIRSIQRAEGNVDCFRRRGRQCRETICAWRRYCLEEGPESTSRPGDGGHCREGEMPPR
jgi:hypothetical protein